MNPYEVTDLAASDIAEIWSYIATDNEDAADRMLQKFYAGFSALSEFPGAGRRRDDISQGLRSFPVGNCIIYYRVAENAVQVERVLHAARNVRKSMFR